ncbi:MHYT domain-containing protein [Colwellia psychrerythraea]|uniref:histidine kinase n=1 Tax=Colwellia psychrerythraea TaxID=28229 RepID=A0A099KHX0_COLPS|nr:MHYT domain-containing protein [Colwellia psychrerythraea]KGJ89860.1 putative PAS/PAC sensor protein [Colwellia psychrerythraea]
MFDFWRFQSINQGSYKLLSSEFDWLLVALSIVVAIFASYSTLVILDRIRASDNQKIINFWLFFGCFVLGSGVWAMHYTGMLAFKMPMTMSFSLLITALSILPIFIASYFTLRKISQSKFDFWNIQLSALSLALGIGTMHFIGMEAMKSEAVMVYNLPLFLASILVAHLLATITLYLTVLETRIDRYQFIVRILCSIVMGGTVTAMHYTAMISVSFYVPDNTKIALEHMSHGTLVIPVAIAGIISVLVVTTILCALIDKRLQAAELLVRESAIREKDIVEHLPDGLLVIDSKGKIVSSNTAAQNMFNLPCDAITKLMIEQLIPSITYSKLVDDVVLFDHVFSGQTILIEGRKKNGDTFPIEAHFSKMTLVIDYQIMFSCVMRDITERVNLEAQLNQANKLESIGQLAAGIAHEINTPTQYVTDNTSFLKGAFASCIDVIKFCQNISSKPTEDINKEDINKMKGLLSDSDIEFILEEVPSAITQSLEGLHRISTIVKAMKSFSHPSKGEMQLTSISEAIETTITVARNEWRYIAELVTQFDDDLPKIMCIRDELNQVFLNIIVNATHAIEENSTKSGQIDGKIKILATRQGENIIIKVVDNGAGMTAETQERIFDPFYTTKDVGKGTGQGLSLAYSVIVDRHKGKIEAHSILGEGTTFTISLPIDNDLNLEDVSLTLEKDFI